MPLWRCPHCGIPQVESSRCWVCRRSTTSCAACRHFRRGIAGGLGFCGLDPRRLALRGPEMRECWEAAETTGTVGPPDEGASAPARLPVTAASVPPAEPGSRMARTFVPVESLAVREGRSARVAQADVIAQADAIIAAYPGIGVMPPPERRGSAGAIRARRIPGGWSLWGDFET